MRRDETGLPVEAEMARAETDGAQALIVHAAQFLREAEAARLETGRLWPGEPELVRMVTAAKIKVTVFIYNNNNRNARIVRRLQSYGEGEELGCVLWSRPPPVPDEKKEEYDQRGHYEILRTIPARPETPPSQQPRSHAQHAQAPAPAACKDSPPSPPKPTAEDVSKALVLCKPAAPKPAANTAAKPAAKPKTYTFSGASQTLANRVEVFQQLTIRRSSSNIFTVETGDIVVFRRRRALPVLAVGRRSKGNTTQPVMAVPNENETKVEWIPASQALSCKGPADERGLALINKLSDGLEEQVLCSLLCVSA